MKSIFCCLVLALMVPGVPASASFAQDDPLPALTVTIDTGNKVYKVGQKVAFDLVVTNTGKIALKALKIDEKSTFCSFNGSEWGTKNPSGDPVVILMPGESMRKKFMVSGLRAPGDLNVNCSYGMGVNKVRPEVHKTLNIVR